MNKEDAESTVRFLIFGCGHIQDAGSCTDARCGHFHTAQKFIEDNYQDRKIKPSANFTAQRLGHLYRAIDLDRDHRARVEAQEREILRKLKEKYEA